LPLETASNDFERRHQLARGEHLDLDLALGHLADALGQALGAGAQPREVLGPRRDHLELLDVLGERGRRERGRRQPHARDRTADARRLDELTTSHGSPPDAASIR
jgi:hypothetical protein